MHTEQFKTWPIFVWGTSSQRECKNEFWSQELACLMHFKHNSPPSCFARSGCFCLQYKSGKPIYPCYINKESRQCFFTAAQRYSQAKAARLYKLIFSETNEL